MFRREVWPMIDRRIGILGTGNMGTAILRGLLAAQKVDRSQICISDANQQRVSDLKAELGVATAASNRALVEFADVVVLAVKPQILTQALDEAGDGWQRDSLIMSVLAGVATATLEARVPSHVRVVRAMPNTAALVLQSATGITAGSRARGGDMDLARDLFSCVGRAVQVPENLMDAVTGLSGSGPAFVLLALEAMADGAVCAGMPRPLALELAAQTMLGTAQMLLSTGEHPAVLKDRVTSPAGTTIAGLMELEAAGARHAFARAVTRAAERATELGKKS
jgi:pyrroline-5-carboxylate reductase